MADLTDPSERYQDSYLEALQEFQAEGRHLENIIEVEQWPAKVCHYWIQLYQPNL